MKSKIENQSIKNDSLIRSVKIHSLTNIIALQHLSI